MKIGYIGVGIMGAPMARHLQKAGHDLFLTKNKSPLPAELLEAGAVECASPAEVALNAEVVFLNVPDTPDVEQVLFGKHGLAETLGAGKVVVDNSTISPTATIEFAKKIEALGSDYVDAPVSGGEIGAQNGTLSVMVGAKEQSLSRVRPLLEAFGKTITHIGPVGTGQTCKASNQIVVALTIEAVAEALVFAAKAGANPEKVREALLGGFAGSKILEIHGQRMIDGDYSPGFRIDLHQKDLAIALETARRIGAPLPNTGTAQALLNTCQAGDGWQRDSAAMATALEKIAELTITEAVSKHRSNR